MIKFSKKVEYALTSLLHLDFVQTPGNVRTREISELYNIPEEHLGKVLQRMVRAGYLRSVKGPHGGYALERPLKEIKLGELVETLDGPPRVSHEGEDHEICMEFCGCFVKGAVHEVQLTLMDYMNNLTVEEAVHRRESQSV